MEGILTPMTHIRTRGVLRCQQSTATAVHAASRRFHGSYFTARRLHVLLHVGNFSVQERDLDVFINVNQLGSEIDDLVGIAERGFYLVRGLSFFYLLRFLWGLLLRLSSASVALVVVLLVVAIPISISVLSVVLIAALVLILILAVLLGIVSVVDGQDLTDGVDDLRDSGALQAPFGELENDFGFIE